MEEIVVSVVLLGSPIVSAAEGYWQTSPRKNGLRNKAPIVITGIHHTDYLSTLKALADLGLTIKQEKIEYA